MANEEINALALEAGFAPHDYTLNYPKQLKRFAELVKKQVHAEFRALSLEIAADIIAEAKDQERDRVCKIVYGLCLSDNNAFEIVQAIKAVTEKGASNHDAERNDSTG